MATADTPKTIKAYKSLGENGSAELKEVPLPKLRDDYVLVKTSHVALNPTDWKHIDYLPSSNCTVGCDFSGVVVASGPDVQRKWTPGQRICGVVHGVNHIEPEDGAFGEYLVAKGDLQLATPEGMSDVDAATLGVGVITVGMGLYFYLNLPWPGSVGASNEANASVERTLLVYGASTATGLYALQFAKLSGWKTIAVCSPRNFDLVKKYGADVCFDYKDPDQCIADIKKETNDALTHAFDCISEGSSTSICFGALGARGGKYVSLLPIAESKLPRKDVKADGVFAYTCIGERIEMTQRNLKLPPIMEHFDFTKKFVQTAEKLLSEGKVKATPTHFRDGGLEKIHEGLDDLRNNKVSGGKVVYKIGNV